MEDKNTVYINHLLNVMGSLPIEDKVTLKLYQNTYLTRENNQENYVYILVNGVIITSLEGTDGEKLNLSYMNHPVIVTLLREEKEKLVDQPYDIKIDSNLATFYKVNRVRFWEIVNNDEILSQYIKIHYRQRISEHIQRARQNVSNNKFGQVCSFIYRCTKLFGVKDENTGEFLINHKITHQTIGEFCGIRSRSSVTRIIKILTQENVIEHKSRLIVVKDMAYLEKYAA